MHNSDFYLYSFLISYFILIFWFSMILLLKDWVYDLHCKWFSMSKEDFDKIHYFLMGFYKLLIFVMFMIPYLSLKLSS